MDASAAIDIAEKFVAARRSGAGLSEYPGALPNDLESAYAIQNAAVVRFGESIAGWKVGRIHPPMSDKLGVDRLAGPIFGNSVQYVNGSGVIGQIFGAGFGAAEAEFLILLGSGIDPRKQRYTLEEATRHIVAVHVGIEIASSPFLGINDFGPLVTISDFGNNNGIIIGEAIADWANSDFSDWDVELLVDRKRVGEGRASSFPDSAIGSVRFLLENLAARGIAVPEGTWVSSGAVTGVHPVKAGQHVEARFANKYSVSCSIEAAPTS